MRNERNANNVYFKGDVDMMKNIVNKEADWFQRQCDILDLTDSELNHPNVNKKKSRNFGYTAENKRFEKYGIKNYMDYMVDDAEYDDFVA